MTAVNGIYVLQGVAPAQIDAAPVGVKVVECYDDSGNLFSAAQVAQMEGGGGLLLGYFSIGEAENYRDYFSSLPASVLGPQDPSWPGDYQVAYWTSQWWTVCTNYIDTMLAQGYQGAFLDVVDECDTSWAKNNAPGGDATGAMVTLVANLAAYAHAQNPSFQIWANISGSEELAANTTFQNAINGAFEEELFYQDNGSPQSKATVDYNLNYLKQLVGAGKPVVDVEYVSSETAIADIKTKAAAAGIGYYIANPNLALDGVDTQGFSPACFVRGTKIATPIGERTVETLAIGDLVQTWLGKAKPIKWIGRRAYGSRFVAGNRAVLPICIEAGSLADGVPSRNLYVSPEHALVIDDHFVPARRLVNGVTIKQVDTIDHLEYFHIELDSHDVVFAEGAASETFIDVGGRGVFHNAAEFATLYPEAEPAAWEPYETLLKAGDAVLPNIRAALLTRAAAFRRVGLDPDLHLIVDGAIVRPLSVTSDRIYRFPVLASAGAVTIASRSVVPYVREADSCDDRPLGVPFERAMLTDGGLRLEITAGCPALREGFHGDEGSHRWTDGRGVLPRHFIACFTGDFTIEIQVGATALHYATAGFDGERRETEAGSTRCQISSAYAPAPFAAAKPG